MPSRRSLRLFAGGIKLIKENKTRVEFSKKIGQLCARYNKKFNWGKWNNYIEA
jgi:hypothetical protein